MTHWAGFLAAKFLNQAARLLLPAAIPSPSQAPLWDPHYISPGLVPAFAFQVLHVQNSNWR